MTCVLLPPDQHKLPLLTAGYPMFFVSIGPNSGQQRKYGANQKIRQTWVSITLFFHISLLVHTAKSSYFHYKINSAKDTRNLFRTFNSLFCPPPPPPTTSIIAEDFATFFTEKTRTISNQFSPPHTQDLQPTTSTAQTPIFSFCPLTEAEVSKLLLSSHPTTCPLDPIPTHLLQAISPTLLPALTHIINTSLLTGTFPRALKQARVSPLLKKPTLNTFLIESYRPISLLPFIAKMLEQVVFNQVSLFISQNNKLDANQSGFRSGHSTETASLSHWSPTNCKSWFQIISPHSAESISCFWYCQSSDPPVNHQILPSHHWTSQGFHLAGLNPISLVGLSRGPGEGRFPKHINWSLGFLRGQFLNPSSSPHTLHHSVPSYKHMVSPTIAMLITLSCISHFDLMIQR